MGCVLPGTRLEMSIPMETKGEIWMMVIEGKGIVMWTESKGQEPISTTATSEVEIVIGIEVLGDVKWMVSPASDDEVGIKNFSEIENDDEVKKGMYSGILKIWGTVDDDMGGCTEIGIIEAGTHVETWYNWDDGSEKVDPTHKANGGWIDERSSAEEKS